MAIYHKLLFGLLVSEVATYGALMVPLPNAMRQKLLIWTRDNIINRVQYTLKIVGVFVFILFIDSVNSLFKAMEKGEELEGSTDIRIDTSIQVKKFYAQRNVYLSGFTMLLSFILNYTFEQIIEVLEAKERLASLETQAPNGSAITQKFDDQVAEISRLTEEVKLTQDKSVDFNNLKTKTEAQQVEYKKLLEELETLKKST